MKSLLEIYDLAEQSGISVTFGNYPASGSIAVHGNVALDYGLCGRRERVHLAHELGHCETGSFYNRHSPCDVRQKHENRADKWAIKKLIPEDELKSAVKSGYTEIWELAEHFGVTDEFMEKAARYYNGDIV